MPKVSSSLMVLLVLRIPIFRFTRISIDKAALYVSAPSDSTPKGTHNLSLTMSSHRNETGNRTESENTSHVRNLAALEHAQISDSNRSKLHVTHPKLAHGRPGPIPQNGVKTVPSRLVDATPIVSSTLSDSSRLETVANLNPSAVGPKNGTKADADSEFFEAAHVVVGGACRRSGFFARRGCALGCTCAWYEYCDTSVLEVVEFSNAGTCAARWSLALLGILLICCLNTCIYVACCLRDESCNEMESTAVEPESFCMEDRQSFVSQSTGESEWSAWPLQDTRLSGSHRSSRIKRFFTSVRHTWRDHCRSHTMMLDGQHAYYH